MKCNSGKNDIKKLLMGQCNMILSNSLVVTCPLPWRDLVLEEYIDLICLSFISVLIVLLTSA